MIERGLAYRKTDKMDLLWSKWGSCSSGGVWRTAKRDSTGHCSSPPLTPSSLHGLLFIHHRPLPASTCDCSSTGSCSSSLHRALLHQLLFNHPLHRLLLNHPSTGYCSSTPPLSTVHPALHGVVLFIQPSTGPVHPTPTGSIDRGPVHPEATPRGPVHPPPPATVHPNPPAMLAVHPEAASIGFS